jgi:hypothetical protein
MGERMSAWKKAGRWLIGHSEPPIHWLAVIWWWEIRRALYNVILAAAGIVSFAVFFWAITTSGELKDGEDAVEPVGMMAALIIVPLAANACYTLGWMVELCVRAIAPRLTKAFGPVLFLIGVCFSIALVSLPAVLWVLIRLFGWRNSSVVSCRSDTHERASPHSPSRAR